MRRAIVAALAVLVLAGCAETEFSRANTTEEQARRDASACRSYVNAQLRRDRNIDQDISTTVGTQSQRVRPGATLTREQMSARGDEVRAEHLMEDCMRARGYAGARDAQKAKTAPATKP